MPPPITKYISAYSILDLPQVIAPLVTDDPPLIANGDISGHRVVAGLSDTQITYADKDTPTHKSLVLGITRNAARTGDSVMVQSRRVMTEPSWNWTQGMPLFLANNGMMTQNVPQTGFVMELGVALTPQTMWINIGPAIELA